MAISSLAEQLGQLLIVGLDQDAWNRDTEEFLREVHPGGVIFFQRNITSVEGFRILVEQTEKFLETPPFLALDLEGGSVDRLRDVLAPLPAVRDVAAANQGRELGRIAGRELAVFGLNVDFAPVLDLGSPDSRQVLGSRTAGESPEDVVRFARSFLEGLKESGILGCGKHFPGLGSGQKDSHKELPCIEKSERQMWEEDLLPFRMLASELPMIMVAHAYCPALERALGSDDYEMPQQRLPATLSARIVYGLLKARMGYHGLAIADDLEMGGVLEGRSMDEAAVAALKAGCDILLLCGPSGNTRRTYQALLREANNDPQFRSRIEQAAENVSSAKNRLGVAGPQTVRSQPDFNVLRQEIKDFSTNLQRQLQVTASGAQD